MKIYADFNCPFCYALSERLADESGQDFEWCYVEHATTLNSHIADPGHMSLLSSEYDLVCQRAPDVAINKPPFCVNSRLPILVFLTVVLKHPEKAQRLRLAFYRAYWRDGSDISDIDVLRSLLAEQGISWCGYSEDAVALQNAHQKCWESGDFDLRIPSMESATGAVMLGLQHVKNIENFRVHGNGASNNEVADACVFTGKYQVAVIGFPITVEVVAGDAEFFQWRHYDAVDNFLRDQALEQIDAVVLWLNDASDVLKIAQLKDGAQTAAYYALICVGNHQDAITEQQAFHLGARDYLDVDMVPATLAIRLKVRIDTFRAFQLLSEYASVDGLTGVFNRRALDRDLEKAWRMACRNNQSLSIILLDIDYFKHYNDGYGHFRGDDCLRLVAQQLKSSLLRAEDAVYRFGGEEFVVLLHDTDEEGAQTVVDRIRADLLRANIEHSFSTVSDMVTVSMGICTARPHADQTVSQVMDEADAALYCAKASGRNAVEFRQLLRPAYAR